MMPARTAAWSGSPFLTFPDRISRTASALIVISPVATASRLVTALSPTSTIRTSPRGPTCVSVEARPLPDIVITLRKVEREAFERHGQVHALEFHVGRHLQRSRRKVENGLDAGGDDLLHHRLRIRRGHRDDADVEAVASRDLLQFFDVVNGDAAARPLADLLVGSVEQCGDLEPFLPEPGIVGKCQT